MRHPPCPFPFAAVSSTFARRGATTLLPLLAAVLAAAIGGAPAAARAQAAAPSFEAQREACLRGRTSQDPKDCLREAAAARADAQRGGAHAPAGGSAQHAENARKRCDRLPAEDREDCLARVRGEGRSVGSVEGGGIYRETRRVVPAASAPR